MKLLFLIVSLSICCIFAEEGNGYIGITDNVITDMFNKKCETDADCEPNQCCAKIFILGKKCRNNLLENSICGTFSEGVVNNIHQRCPCGTGLTCTHHRSIVGLVKMYKCKRNGN